MECELGQIKSIVDMNIRELKNVFMRPKSSSSSSSSLLTVSKDYLAESIISSAKFAENIREGRRMSNCCEGRFSATDDTAVVDEKDNDLMANK
jgi:hypothetical protein